MKDSTIETLIHYAISLAEAMKFLSQNQVTMNDIELEPLRIQ